MMLTFRPKEFWYRLPNFIHKPTSIPKLGIKLVGFFPYHTARILFIQQPQIPRVLFQDLESILTNIHVLENKAVYIFEVLSEYSNCDNFALMLKDEWTIIGGWDLVVNWDNSPLTHK